MKKFLITTTVLAAIAISGGDAFADSRDDKINKPESQMQALDANGVVASGEPQSFTLRDPV